MSTSSLYKTFSLRTKSQTDIFMQKFEELLCKSSKIEKSGMQMTLDEDTAKFIIYVDKNYQKIRQF